MSICSDVCHDLLLISDQSSDVCHSPMIHSWSVTVEVCHSPMICSWSMTKTCVTRSYDLLLIDDHSMSVTLLWSTLDYSNQDPSCITLLWSSLDQLPDSWWLSLSYVPFLISDHCSVSLTIIHSWSVTTVVCHSPMIHSWSVTTVVCHSPMIHSWSVTTVVCPSPMIHSWSVTRALMTVILPWSTRDQWLEFWCLSFSYDTLLVSDCSWSISYSPLCPLPLIHTWSLTATLVSFTLLSSTL